MLLSELATSERGAIDCGIRGQNGKFFLCVEITEKKW